MLSMHSGCRSNADSLQALMLEKLVIVRVKSDAPGLEVLLAPGKFLGIRGVSCYEFGTRRAVEEMEGMAGTHTAETRDGDAESADLRSHCVC